MAAARAEGQHRRGRSDLGEALEALESEWGDTLAHRGVRLDVRRTAKGMTVGADAEVVERVLGPLLDNAGRYAAGHVTMEGMRAGGRVRILVRDDGPGLGEGQAERVFEPGVRGERANGHGGAGLGLPLARRLARAAGGEVTAGGMPDGGATFVVELPA
jgi:signal transduction histidine kinase